MNRSSRFRWLPMALVVPAALLGRQLLMTIDSDRLTAVAAGASLVACFLACRRRRGLRLLSPAALYLVVFGLFHLGMALPWAVGFYDEKLPPWFLSNRLTPALALVALALACYLAGLLSAPSAAPLEPRAAPIYVNRLLFALGLAVYLAGCGMFLAGIQTFGGARFFDAGYAETYRLTAQFDPRLFGTSFTFVPIGLYLAAASFPGRWIALVVAISLVWVGGILFLGFRGYALIPGLVVLAVLDRRGYRVPAWAGGALVAAVLAAIPLTRLMRDQSVRQRSPARSWTQVRLLDGVVEMGGSLRPLVHTVAYVDGQSRRWGATYWQSLAAVWPNLSQRWGGGRYIPLDDLPPNHWLTAQAEPDMYRHHGGLGFSAVAEPYMNFGVAGVAAYFLALGALLVRADGPATARPVPLALWAVVLGPLLWTARNSFEIFFRPAVWGAALVLAAWCAAPLARSARWRPRLAPVLPPEPSCALEDAHARAGGL